MASAPGLRRRPLGHRVGGCGWGSLASKVHCEKPRVGRGCRVGPQPRTESAPGRAPSRGDERLQERAEWRRFRGSARPSAQPGAAGGPRKLGTLSTTHTLVGRFAQLTQALPARRGHLEEPHHRHIDTYTHPYICEHRHTSRTPAPTGAQSPAQKLLRRLHDQQRAHTSRGHR